MNTKAAASVVVVSVLGVGALTACGGSNSAAESASGTPSVSATPSSSHDAGFFTKDINLTITNDSGKAIEVTKTTSTTKSAAHGGGTKPAGSQYLASNATIRFDADMPGADIKSSVGKESDRIFTENRAFGLPVFYYGAAPLGRNKLPSRSLEENESFTWESPTTGHVYVLSRGNDTNFKNMSIKIVE